MSLAHSSDYEQEETAAQERHASRELGDLETKPSFFNEKQQHDRQSWPLPIETHEQAGKSHLAGQPIDDLSLTRRQSHLDCP